MALEESVIDHPVWTEHFILTKRVTETVRYESVSPKMKGFVTENPRRLRLILRYLAIHSAMQLILNGNQTFKKLKQKWSSYVPSLI